MARILLVDDEPLVTDTLRTLILDEMPDLEVFCTNSSAHAMELVDQNVYDIVVTDVAMPRFSGLDLLDHIRQQGSFCYVIVLTAYNSFDYAYKASRYGDVRFILKVEPPDVIMDAVRSGLEKIQQYYSTSENNQRLRTYMQEALPLLRQTLLERLLLFGEELPDKTIRESCGINAVPGKATWLAATGTIPSQEKRQKICGLVLSMLRDRGLRADAWYSETGLVYMIQADDDGFDIPTMIRGPLDRIIEGVGTDAGLAFALSSEPIPWLQLGEAAAALAGYAGRTLENGRIRLKNPLAEEVRNITLSDILRWRRSMEQRNLPQLSENIRTCIRREGYPRGRQRCAMLLQMLLAEIFGDDCLDGISAAGYSAEMIFFHGHFETAETWLEAVCTLLEAMFSGSNIRQMSETEDTLNRINRYIQEHFTEQISLTQIADTFNYNSSYLSRIYKQNMGEGINEHIIRTRTEAACRLLQESGMSVSSVAEQCGFQTTKYFITVFKRMMGATPKLWRETH